MGNCAFCGHQLATTDKFCPECGTAVKGATSPAPVKGHWEYKEFSRSLGNTKLKSDTHLGGHWPLEPHIANAINAAVQELIQTAAADGWEPAESFDPNTLYRAGKVERKIGSTFGGWKITLIDVRLSFRRWADN